MIPFPNTHTPAPAQAAAAKKLMELKKTRQAKGGQAGSWVRVDSKYIASTVPAVAHKIPPQQPRPVYPPQSAQVPTQTEEPAGVTQGTWHGQTDSNGESQGRSAASAAGREVWQQQPPPPPQQQQSAAAVVGQRGYSHVYQSMPPAQQPQQGGGGQRAQYGNSQEGATHQQQVQRGWVPQQPNPQEAGGSSFQPPRLRHESPLQQAQHELAVEKYKNALLREKEAEKEMKPTDYRRHKTTQGDQKFAGSTQSRGRPSVPPPLIAQGGAGEMTTQVPVVARAVPAPAGAAPLVKAVAVSENDDWTRPRAPPTVFTPSTSTSSASQSSNAPASSALGSPSIPWPHAPEAAEPQSALHTRAHAKKSSLPVSAHSSEKDLNAWAEGKPLSHGAQATAATSIYNPAAESDAHDLAKWSEGGAADSGTTEASPSASARTGRQQAGQDRSGEDSAISNFSSLTAALLCLYTCLACV